MTDGRHSDGQERPGSGASPPPTDPGATGDGPRGRIRHQDGSTTPREPTLAEKRAREQKLRADREEVRRREARSKTTKRVLIGAGATIGVVALIAAVYAASGGGSETVEAHCTDEQGVIVPDEVCEQATASQGQVATGGGGFAFVPIFLGGGGRQYHYTYGGTGNVGQVATGGNVTPPPSGTTVRSGTNGSTIGSTTRSGTISRGGLGVGGSSTSSGGSSTSSGS
ncbi:hypothetical protein [Pseudonocardia sp. NPDC049635]|uniref:hypothetical protein n=1 Tax=Pseudonocardia sp. NPDC049635 TaxID=3155506 RepID=UPI0033C38183